MVRSVALIVAAGALPAILRPDATMAQGSAAEALYSLPRSSVATVRSASGEPYRILVALPENDPPAAGWPVLYVLDGEDTFAIAALTARRLARAGGRSGVGEGIVVGIEAGPLPRRVRDYTPATPDWTIPKGRPATGLATGGGEAFLDLLEQQVRPFVARRWRVDHSRQTLLGHSFGGLIALHAAVTRPALFDGVMAVSPSLWFGDGLIAREVAGASPRARILIAEGDQQMPSDAVTDISPMALAQSLNRDQADGRARFLALPGQSHGTTMLAAMAPAIAFAFGQAAAQ